MEMMLQTFRTFNISEFAFFIVNSNKHDSQKVLWKLTSRVSFPVYQDTVEEGVWEKMSGGKDDMYIYDRCGRLAYFIPFPLSIIHGDSPLVFTSLLSTYFDSPCGSLCDENNKTYDFEKTLAEISDENHVHTTHDDFGVSNETRITTDDILTVTEVTDIQFNKDEFDQLTNESLTDNESYLDLMNFNISLSNDNFSNYSDEGNVSIIHNIRYYTENINVLSTNETYVAVQNGNLQTSPNVSDLTSNDFRLYNQTESLPNSSNLNTQNSTKDLVFMENENDAEYQPPRRGCVQEDRKVCVHWTKRRQKAAEICCSADTNHKAQGVTTENDMGTCKNFTRKRCKKLKTIIKCCSEFVVHSESNKSSGKDNKSDM